ncbi:MAG: hypothetical protein U0521_12180 [Anaerolineae bacterium]
MEDQPDLLSRNQQLAEEVRRRGAHLAAINTVAASVSQSLDLNRTLQTALETILGITGAEAGGISLIEDRRATWSCAPSRAGFTISSTRTRCASPKARACPGGSSEPTT